MLGATTVTTVFYLAAKSIGAARARTHIRSMLYLFDVASIDLAVLVRALDRGFDDYEDGVLHEAGLVAGVDALVTRDPHGFAVAEVPVFTPAALLAAVRGAAT